MLHRPVIVRLDGPESVDRLSQRVDDAAGHLFSYGHAGLFPGTRHLRTLYDTVVGSEEHAPDHLLFEVLRDARGAVFKFHQLAVHHALQAVNICDTVADTDDAPRFLDLHLTVIIFYFTL